MKSFDSVNWSHKVLYLGLLLLSIAVTDIYLPSMPFITEKLGVPRPIIEIAMGIGFSGFFISSFLWGVFAKHKDNFELLQLAAFGLIASLLGFIFIKDILDLIFFRLLQGVCGAGVSALCTVLLLNLAHTPKERATMQGYIGPLIPLTLSFAPILGGFLVNIGGANAPFLCLAFLLGIFFVGINLDSLKDLVQNFRLAKGWPEILVFSGLYVGFVFFLYLQKVHGWELLYFLFPLISSLVFLYNSKKIKIITLLILLIWQNLSLKGSLGYQLAITNVILFFLLQLLEFKIQANKFDNEGSKKFFTRLIGESILFFFCAFYLLNNSSGFLGVKIIFTLLFFDFFSKSRVFNNHLLGFFIVYFFYNFYVLFFSKEINVFLDFAALMIFVIWVAIKNLKKYEVDSIFSSYLPLFSSPYFLIYSLIPGIIIGGSVSFQTKSTFWFKSLGFSPLQYSLFFAVPLLLNSLAGFVSSKLGKIIAPENIIKIACSFALIGSFASLFAKDPITVTIAYSLFSMGIGLSSTTCSILLIEEFFEHRAILSAASSSIRVFLIGFVITLFSYISKATFSLLLSSVLSSILLLGVVFGLVRKTK